MQHNYDAHLVWTGNLGSGTERYPGYSREHRVMIAGKPDLVGSADAVFQGEAEKHNPEDWFLAAIAGCHMLAYLALCARGGVSVLAYEDRASGTLVTKPDGSGGFENVLLSPVVTIAAESDERLALRLHDTAHEQCFIANSCSVAIRHEATVQVAFGAVGGMVP